MSLRIGGFAQLLGFTITSADGDHVNGKLDVTPRLQETHGTLHQGVYSSVVETAASVGASLWLGLGDLVGVSNHTHYLQATRSDVLLVTARPVHREATSQLWEVAIADETGRLVAMGSVELAHRGHQAIYST